MKKKVALLMIMVILTGCSSKDEDVEKNVDDILETGTSSNSAAINTHLNENISSYDTVSLNSCETKYGFYASIFGEIIYMDKETGKRMAVCAKPNCNHNRMRYDEDEIAAGKVQCDGYLWNNNQVCVYNGKILLDRTDDSNKYTQIIKEDLDGSNKEALIENIFPEDCKEDCSSSTYGWRLHNDIIYVFTSSCYREDLNKCLRICLEKFDAKTGERLGIVYEKTYHDDGADIAVATDMTFHNDVVYITVTTDIDIGDGYTCTEEGVRICMSKLLKVNLSTGEANFVPFPDDYDMTSYGLKDDKMVYGTKNYNLKMVNIETQEVNFDIPVEDLKSVGDNICCVGIVGEYIIVRIDKEYIKGDDKYASKLMFFDMNGKLLDEVFMKKTLYPQLANENIMMLTNGSQSYAYINIEEIGTGEINLIEFEK